MPSKRMTKKKVAEEGLTPIPEKKKKEWEALIKKGRTLVASQDKAQWGLVEIFGKLDTWGDGIVARYADKIGINKRTGFEYRKMYQLGATKEFLTKYNTLSYTMIREILFHAGNATNPAAVYFLDYASEHTMTVRAMQAYMMDTAARNNSRDEAQADIKMALQTKQEMEGFPDVIRYELEAMVEQNPGLQESVLRTAIMNADDVIDLKRQAGLLTDAELDMVEESKRIVNKIKTMQRWLLDHKKAITDNLEYGHEVTDDIRFNLERLNTTVEEMLETVTRSIDPKKAKKVERLPAPESKIVG